jgi:hypothetical protein
MITEIYQSLAETLKKVDLQGVITLEEFHAAMGARGGFPHLTADDNAQLQSDLGNLLIGVAPKPSLQRLTRSALGGPITTIEDLQKRLLNSPVPRSYLPETSPFPGKTCIYLYSANQEEMISANQEAMQDKLVAHKEFTGRVMARISGRFQHIAPNGRQFTECGESSLGENPRSSSQWDDMVIVDVKVIG